MPEHTPCPRCRTVPDEYGNCECPLTERGRYEHLTTPIPVGEIIAAHGVLRKRRLLARFAHDHQAVAAIGAAEAVLEKDIMARAGDVEVLAQELGVERVS